MQLNISEEPISTPQVITPIDLFWKDLDDRALAMWCKKKKCCKKYKKKGRACKSCPRN